MNAPPGQKREILKGSIYVLTSMLAIQGTTLLVNILISRMLGKESFGQYSVVQSMLVMVSNLAQLSMGAVVAKFLAEYKDVDKARAGAIYRLCVRISTLTSLAFALGVGFASPWIAGGILRQPSLALPIAISSIYIFFQGVQVFSISALTALESYTRLAAVAVWTSVVYTVLVGFGAFYGGVFGAITALTAFGAISTFAFSVARRKAIQLNQIDEVSTISPEDRKAVLQFALPSIVSGYAVLPFAWWSNAFLVQQGGFGEAANFIAANNMRMGIILVPLAMNTVGITMLNKVLHHRDGKVFRQIGQNTLGLMVASAAFLSLLLGAVAPFAMGIFGHSYRASAPVLVTLLLSTVPECVAMSMRQRVHSIRRLWEWLLFALAPSQIAFLVATVILVPRLHAYGAALSYGAGVLGYMVASVLLWTWLSKRDEVAKSLASQVNPGEISLDRSQ